MVIRVTEAQIEMLLNAFQKEYDTSSALHQIPMQHLINELKKQREYHRALKK